MSLKKIVLILFSCLFFATMVNAEVARSLAQATEKIKQHTEPRFRNTFMVFSKDEIKCLALNVYHEARNESLSGKIGVILVTMNRVADERFPGTICEVVHQGKHYYNKQLKKRYPIKNMCQFSWYCDSRVDVPKNKRAWTYSQALADYVLIKEKISDKKYVPV